MFKEIFIDLCNKKNVSPTSVCLEIGLSKAAFSEWTDTTVPRRATLQKIATYFDVSVDYLLGKQDEPLSRQAAAEIESTLSAEESEILKKLKQLDDDQAKQMLDYLEFLIQQRKKKE